MTKIETSLPSFDASTELIQQALYRQLFARYRSDKPRRDLQNDFRDIYLDVFRYLTLQHIAQRFHREEGSIEKIYSHVGLAELFGSLGLQMDIKSPFRMEKNLGWFYLTKPFAQRVPLAGAIRKDGKFDFYDATNVVRGASFSQRLGLFEALKQAYPNQLGRASLTLIVPKGTGVQLTEDQENQFGDSIIFSPESDKSIKSFLRETFDSYKPLPKAPTLAEREQK